NYTINRCLATDYSFKIGAPQECRQNCKLATIPGQHARCFATDQDPTVPPNLADEIKNEGVRVFSIAILDQQDDRFNTQLKQLLQNVASPDSFYVSPTGQDLTDIMNKI